MAEHNQVYQQAIYYDVIFDRDVGPEVDFLLGVYKQHTGHSAMSVLDIACGPGYHARACAALGLQATGLDLRPEMVEFARIKPHGTACTWIVADMRSFSLEQPVDLAFAMFDSGDALQTNGDIVAHLRMVAANLTDNGLYVLDYTHPSDASLLHYKEFIYRGERDDLRVELAWQHPPDFDLTRGLARSTTHLTVWHGTEQVAHITDTAFERLVMPQELELLAALSGVLTLAAWYGDYRLEAPLEAERGARMIAVLQKQ